MSQLKKALERAKEERRYRDVMDEGATIPAPPESPPPDTEPTAVTSSAEEFDFTDTRVMEVSPEELLRNRIVAADENDASSDRFKSLRTQVFQKTRPKKWNTIQVTGFGIGDGKSTVAANLAISIAKDTRQTTLLVDLDFRKPTIGRLLGINHGSAGLSSYFLEGQPIEELLVSPGIKKLTVLPAGSRVNNAAEILGSPKMESLIAEIKNRYHDRYIIIDTPAINCCSDPLIVSEYVDAILLVARAEHTTRESIKAAMEKVPKEKVLGIVMNDFTGKQPNYYY
jgi:protein-tyrosine kinase